MRRRRQMGFGPVILSPSRGKPGTASSPENPFVGNAGQRDPRGASAAYMPGPADLKAGTKIRGVLNNGVQLRIPPGHSSLQHAIDASNGADLPTPAPAAQAGPENTVEASWPAFIQQVGVANAVQIVPKNNSRRSLKVANPTANGLISFSFNAPQQLGGIGMGIPVDPQDHYEAQNSTISIDAIWVWSDDPSATYPIPVVAFEGVPVSS